METIEIYAVKIGHTIYMTTSTIEGQKNHISQSSQTINNSDGQNCNLYSKQGLKFEHYIFADEPDQEPQPTEKPVKHTRKALRIIGETTFAGHHLLYMFKQKGLEGHPDMLDTLPIPTFLVQTTWPVTPERNYPWERLLYWWQNSILTKAEKCIIGHRKENGMVEKVDIFPTDGLLTEATKEYLKKFPWTNGYEGTEHKLERPNLGKGIFASNWRTGKPMKPQEPPKPKPDAASELGSIISDMNFGFLARFLDYLKATLPKGMGEGPDVVHQFTWHPDREDLVTCRKLIGEEAAAARFIPDWYMTHLQSNGLMPV